MWSVVVLACGHYGLWFLAAFRLCSPCLSLCAVSAGVVTLSSPADKAGGGPGERLLSTHPWENVRMSPVIVTRGLLGPSATCLLIYRMGMCHLPFPVQPWATSLRFTVHTCDMAPRASGLGQPAPPMCSVTLHTSAHPRVHSGQSQPILASSLRGRAGINYCLILTGVGTEAQRG